MTSTFSKAILLIFFSIFVIKSTLADSACCQITTNPNTCLSWYLSSFFTKKYCKSHSGTYFVGYTCSNNGTCVVGSCKKKSTKAGVRSESDPDICTGPDLVELSNFTAKPTNKGVSLNWNTKTEIDSQGFRIWRAIPDLGRYCGCSENIDDYTQIKVLDKKGKPVLIPAEGSITFGFDYSYLDEEAKPGIAYCYALEDINSKGESKFYFEYVAFTQDGLEGTK